MDGAIELLGAHMPVSSSHDERQPQTPASDYLSGPALCITSIDVAEAERDYVPTALSDRAFIETSEFPIEPFSLHEEREVCRRSASRL